MSLILHLKGEGEQDSTIIVNSAISSPQYSVISVNNAKNTRFYQKVGLGSIDVTDVLPGSPPNSNASWFHTAPSSNDFQIFGSYSNTYTISFWFKKSNPLNQNNNLFHVSTIDDTYRTDACWCNITSTGRLFFTCGKYGRPNAIPMFSGTSTDVLVDEIDKWYFIAFIKKERDIGLYFAKEGEEYARQILYFYQNNLWERSLPMQGFMSGYSKGFYSPAEDVYGSCGYIDELKVWNDENFYNGSPNSENTNKFLTPDTPPVIYRKILNIKTDNINTIKNITLGNVKNFLNIDL